MKPVHGPTPPRPAGATTEAASESDRAAKCPIDPADPAAAQSATLGADGFTAERPSLAAFEGSAAAPGGRAAETRAVGEGQRANTAKIPCPALATLFNSGDLNPEADGTMSTADLDDALAKVGVGGAVRAFLVKGADDTDSMPESFNLFKLHDSSLDHTGSTGIRDPRDPSNPKKVDPARLQELLAHGDQGRMYSKHFAAAANQFSKEDPGLVGTAIQTLEFTAILEVFGRQDANSDRYLTDADVKGLWLDAKAPQGWKARPKDDIGLATIAGKTVVMGGSRVLDTVSNFFSRLWK
jgi:hypothetical protein